MHVLPGGKLFFCGRLTEMPAAIQQEERTAGLQEFVFLREREAVKQRYLSCLGSHFQGMQKTQHKQSATVTKIARFTKDGVERNQEELIPNCLL